MGRIRQLDAATANGIAAGEVVERPSSVVKELVENAMDAGATVITVEIEGGGVSLIRVTDDGCGMDEEDAKMAFLVHATSKLKSLQDLFNLHTMGFRGEALSSISAAAKVTLRTKQPSAESGTEVVVEGGHLIRSSSVGVQSGTSIAVRDLFYNLPARYKFLKKDNTEAQYIITLCERFALIRPDISFRLLVQGKEVLHTPGNNEPESTLYCIYGKKTVDSCIYVDEKHGDVQIRGFVGKPEIARSNRNEQIVFVNERLIRSKSITAAIDEGYKTMLMKGRYAFVVLSIYIPSQLVDVNVHPQKAEVRFWNDGEVFRSVYHTIQNALLSRSHVVNFAAEEEVSPVAPTAKNVDLKIADGKPDGKSVSDLISELNESRIPTKAASVQPVVRDEPAEPTSEKVFPKQPELAVFEEEKVEYAVECRGEAAEESAVFELAVSEDAQTVRASVSDEDESESELPGLSEAELREKQKEGERSLGFDFSVHDLKRARVIGVAFATYILLEWQTNLVLLDQHAAHEKILFEQLVEKRRSRKDTAIPRQSLLIPEMISLSASDAHFLAENEEQLRTAGFEFESMGDRELALRGIPAVSVTFNPTEAFLFALDSMRQELPQTDEQVLLLLATTACKAAVKGHDRLHEEEIKALLRDLALLQNPYHCPHGRPIIIRISQRDLEKEFKRIV